MKKILVVLMAFLVTASWTVSAQNLNAPINPDPNVRVGKLENGMTYYLRANGKPEKRIEYRLAVNAGSMQENEDQLGLAHFTEHMAFNGMEGYPGNEVISELQKIGVAFGSGINAYTSFDETVYMLQVPSDDPKYVQMGIDVLYGWATALLMDHEEIDSERGIITEEYRMGLGASDRMRKEWFPVVFHNSRYANRLPIGTLDIIQNFKYQTIKDFYRDWYRPDLQAIIIIGDINVDKMEAQVKEKFGKIKPVANPRAKINYPVEGNKEPLAIVCTDKEASGSSVMLIRKFPHFSMKTEGDFRKGMMHSLYSLMIGSRYNEMQQDPKTPFLGAAAGYGELIGTVDCYMSQASCKEGKVAESIKILMQEDYRILKHGFLDSELKRAKEELLNAYETAAKEVDKTESARFANEYVSHYLHNDPIPGAKREFNLAKKHIESITAEEISALAKQWITLDNFVGVVMAQEKEGVNILTKEELLAIMKNTELANVGPYVDTYKEQEIVYKETLTAGKVTEQQTIADIDAKVLTLSNGIKVYLKKTNFKNDEILFRAQSKGGFSLYGVDDIISASFASDLVDRAGIGELDYASLMKKMKGKKAGVTPYISLLSEGLQGSTAPKDMDFFFQYLNAFFTAPRHDATTYDLVINETVEQVNSIQANPQYQFIGKFIASLTQDDPYKRTALNYTEEYIKSANYERAFAIYKERFANPADFDYVFVGNFDEAELIAMIELYLGSLKTTTARENFRGSVVKDFPTSKIEDVIYAGMDEQSWVGIGFSKEYPWSLTNNMLVSQIGDALDIEVMEIIREEMGGVYSPMLQMSSSKDPKSSYNLIIMFSCSPDNTDKLSNAVLDILTKFQKNGPKAETLTKVKEQMIRKNQTNLESNNYWASYITGKLYNGEDFSSIKTFNDRVNAVTNADIINFMKQYFDVNNYVKTYLYPEAMKK